MAAVCSGFSYIECHSPSTTAPTDHTDTGPSVTSAPIKPIFCGPFFPVSRFKHCAFYDIALVVRLHLKCDGARAETRFRLSAKQTSPFKSAGASVQSTTGSRGVRISGINAGYTMFRDSVKNTGYPLHSVVSPSLPLPALLCAITFQLDSTVGTP